MDKTFDENKNLNSYFKTSDGTAFFNENAAKNHAKTLENKGVEEIKRKIEAAALEAEKPLKKMNHQELKDKASSLTIEFTEETKADLIILIEAKLAELEVEKSTEDDSEKTNENKVD